jgi:hypothetical protein
VIELVTDLALGGCLRIQLFSESGACPAAPLDHDSWKQAGVRFE